MTPWASITFANRNLLAIFLLIISSNLYAQAPKNITDNEMAILPNYCPYTMGFKYGIRRAMQNHPMANGWLNTIGEGFYTLHHYCWARIQINRANRVNTPPSQRMGLRQEALGNLGFVVANSPSDLVLLPEVLTWIGKTELQLGNTLGAKEAFTKAWTINEDYWPAYYNWAEYLYSNMKEEEALDIANQGLQHSPDARPLIELMRLLNLKLKKK